MMNEWKSEVGNNKLFTDIETLILFGSILQMLHSYISDSMSIWHFFCKAESLKLHSKW